MQKCSLSILPKFHKKVQESPCFAIPLERQGRGIFLFKLLLSFFILNQDFQLFNYFFHNFLCTAHIIAPFLLIFRREKCALLNIFRRAIQNVCAFRKEMDVQCYVLGGECTDGFILLCNLPVFYNYILPQ